MTIDDGYTQRAKVPSVDGPIIFNFRPMLKRERMILLREVRAFENAWDDLGWLAADEAVNAHISCPDAHDGWSIRMRSDDFICWQKVFDLVLGIGNDAQEDRDTINLRTGIPLLRKYGHLRNCNTCEWCQAWMFDPSTGETELDDETKQPIPRCAEADLACQTEEGCPNGTPELPLSLSSKNRRAFVHYQECVAVGSFPDDPIVRRNAAIIRAALSRRTRRTNEQPQPLDIHGPIS